MANGIKSTLKSLKLLELFTPQRKEWSIPDMIAGLGYHKSSIQRIVSTLEGEGFLKRVQSNRGCTVWDRRFFSLAALPI